MAESNPTKLKPSDNARLLREALKWINNPELLNRRLDDGNFAPAYVKVQMPEALHAWLAQYLTVHLAKVEGQKAKGRPKRGDDLTIALRVSVYIL